MSALINLLKEKEAIEERIAIQETELNQIMDKIQDLINPTITEERKKAQKDTGTLRVLLDGVEVVHDVPKKVEWDQGLLKNLWSKISSSGDNPETYIEQKFNVSETKFKTFPTPIQAAFAPARTVKGGKPKVTFKIQ